MPSRLVSLVAPPWCAACGAHPGEGQVLCPRCRAQLRWLGPAPVVAEGVPRWAPVAYLGPGRALVGGLKYRGARAHLGAMAAQIAAGMPASLLRRGSVLVPVPLDPARRRRRGFDQAELLAGALARRMAVPVQPCLRRCRGRGHQVGRGRADRLEALTGSVRLARGAAAPLDVVLVDDVITTGATLAACGAALRAAGAERVVAVAYARTLGR